MSRVNKAGGMCKTAEYHIWQKMRYRCQNMSNDKYRHYGGRGIVVCESWDQSFLNFFRDMGQRPSKEHTLDRIDVNGDYEPSNCRWATRKEQMNNKRSNHYIDVGGVTKTLSQWAESSDFSYSTIKSRLYRGWTPGDALVKVRGDGNDGPIAKTKQTNPTT